jgi:dihydropteroate synthase
MPAASPPSSPLVRIVEAGLGADHQVRLVVSRAAEAQALLRAWSSSGATIERNGDRLEAVSTVQALARAAGRTLGGETGDALEAALRRAVTAWGGAPLPWTVRDGRVLRADRRPLVMGVVNVTPDSFSDGGVVYPDRHPDAAVELGRELLAAGADVLDVGGESTRPGAQPVGADEELARVEPVIRALAGEGAVVSVDTTKPGVAKQALAAGAAIVNDVSAAGDDELLGLVANTGAGYVLMHSRGTPADMQSRTDYDDVIAEVFESLADGLQRCAAAGIESQRVAVDPGIGFAKTPRQNVALLGQLRSLRSLVHPVVVGASRKSFIGELLGDDDPASRLEGSLACAVHAAQAGSSVVRAHDVAATVRALTVAGALAGGQPSSRA